MDRIDIEARWRIVDGNIVEAGMYCGLPLFTPYFWEHALRGGGQQFGEWVYLEVSPEDLEMFPELATYPEGKPCHGLAVSVGDDDGMIVLRSFPDRPALLQWLEDEGQEGVEGG